MYNIITNPIIATEPVTLDFYKSYARLGAGTDEDAVIEMFISAAREHVEGICRTDFITKVKSVKIPVNVNLPNDIDENDIISISGGYTTLAEVKAAYWNYVEYIKGFTVNRDCPIDFLNLPTYTITYVFRAADVPSAVKEVICKLASDMYEYRETSASIANTSLSFDYRKLLAPYIKQLI